MSGQGLRCSSCSSAPDEIEVADAHGRSTPKKRTNAEAMLEKAWSTATPTPDLGPLEGASRERSVAIEDVPNEAALAAWLREHGVDVSGWGKGNTKSVGACWKEIKNAESGLELWKGKDGKLVPVRTTHVLRAKVSSAKGYQRGLFLLNTWQQLSNGKKKTRNCLLSEKLMTHEVPVQDNLMAICRRALSEELGYLEDASYELGRGRPAPSRDAAHAGNLEVERAEFIDYQVEAMERGSYPGLVTTYHLYTVDIICRGLPERDFCSLEFREPDPQTGATELKYVHSWSWLEWPQIQRYLLEGSDLKERRRRGSFADEEQLRSWLARSPAIDLSLWGNSATHTRSVRDLYDEVERQEAHLELWGRRDGVPLIIRVVHLLDLLVVGSERQLLHSGDEGKVYLFQTEKSFPDGAVILVNRHVAKKISFADAFGSPGACGRKPSTCKRSEFLKYAREAVESQFEYLEDSHFKLHRHAPPPLSEVRRSSIRVESATLGGHRFFVEESASFKGMLTMYHKYTVEVCCRGLPTDDFVSLEVADGRVQSARAWRWMTWQESQDVLHQDAVEVRGLNGEAASCLSEVDRRLREATRALGAMRRDAEGGEAAAQDLQRQLEEVQRLVEEQVRQSSAGQQRARASGAAALPPNLLDEKATESIHVTNGVRSLGDDDEHSVLKARANTEPALVDGGHHAEALSPREEAKASKEAPSPQVRGRLLGSRIRAGVAMAKRGSPAASSSDTRRAWT